MLTDGHHFSVSYLPYFISVVTNTFGHMCLYCVVGEILAAQVNLQHPLEHPLIPTTHIYLHIQLLYFLCNYKL